MFPVQPPARRAERQHAYLQRIARLRAVDVHRSRHRVDSVEIELFQVGRRGRSRELPRRGIEGLEVHGLARRDLQRRGKRIVPPVVDMIPVNRVMGRFAHRSIS